MFLDFLLHLRKGGIKVSLNEWLALVNGLDKGLHGQTIHGFYILSRTLIVKSETTLDLFDELFYQFFKDITSEDLLREMEELLHHPELAEKIFAAYMDEKDMEPDELRKRLQTRISSLPTEQVEIQKKNSASGVEGLDASYPDSANTGLLQGAGGRSIIHDPGDRKFRDWRSDSTIDSRQFQMAFRLLRELSRKLDSSELELDVMETVNATCKRGGILDVQMRPPRRNKLKLMVLIDSGGTMQPYEELLSLLFQSLNKANTFTDLKIYYFHNCLESRIYKDPSIDTEETIETDWILRNISGDYRVIFVGDADMAMYELVSGGSTSYRSSTADGITWFRKFKEQYSHSVWLHPQEREENENWIPESFKEIEKVFPMYRLSIDGLKDAMYRLMKNN